MNAATLALNDFRLLWRHGFAMAYLVVAVLFAAVLSALPRAWADPVLPPAGRISGSGRSPRPLWQAERLLR